jgi:chromatin assembly factor 1 subunit B
MKVETPQILWNSEEEKGINAALMSVSMLQSGIVDHNTGHYGNVMATAGNTNLINLWRVAFKEASPTSSASSSTSTGAESTAATESTTTTTTTTSSTAETTAAHSNANKATNTMLHRFSPKQHDGTKIDYVCSLTRHDGPVNTVAFSPDGLHLATAGDAGSVIVWSVPVHMRGNGNGRHYWSTITREQDLQVKIVARSGEGVCDISWSADSKRFLAGTIDHSVFVVEDASHSQNNRQHHPTTAASVPVDSAWQVVYRNAMDHTHYVQGVAYDPAGVYLASMSSDRTVRVYPRKTPPKSKKKVLRPANHSASSCSGTVGSATATAVPPHEHATMVQDLLTESKLEMAKSKLVKYRRTVVSTATAEDGTTTAGGNSSTATAGGTTTTSTGTSSSTSAPQQVVNKRHLYADESTLESFFRRLSWTTDGAFLITPAALWQPETTTATGATAATDNTSSTTTSSPYATYMFARHKFDEPYRVLAGLEKVRGYVVCGVTKWSASVLD